MIEIATIDWFGRWGTSVFSENTAIFESWFWSFDEGMNGFLYGGLLCLPYKNMRSSPPYKNVWLFHSYLHHLGNEKLEVVPEFCYLGDMLSAGGGCELAAITRCKCAWGKFRQLLPLLTNRHLPLLTRGKVYSSCVRSVMLHAAETWAMKVDTLNRLRRNDRAKIRWICNVRAKDEVSSDSLLTKLGIQDLDVVLRTSRMRWFGHVERSTGWVAEVRKLNVVAQKRSGRPRKSWDEVLENDRKKLGMDSADPQNRSEWRGRLRERLVKKPNPR